MYSQQWHTYTCAAAVPAQPEKLWYTYVLLSHTQVYLFATETNCTEITRDGLALHGDD